MADVKQVTSLGGMPYAVAANPSGMALPGAATRLPAKAAAAKPAPAPAPITFKKGKPPAPGPLGADTLQLGPAKPPLSSRVTELRSTRTSLDQAPERRADLGNQVDA